MGGSFGNECESRVGVVVRKTCRLELAPCSLKFDLLDRFLGRDLAGARPSLLLLGRQKHGLRGFHFYPLRMGRVLTK